MKLTPHEQKILKIVQDNPSIITDPAKRETIAKKNGLTEKTLRNRIAELKKRDLIEKPSSIIKRSKKPLITENDENSVPNKDLELSWINSLVGSDTFGNYVPDIDLNEKVRYGTSLSPIQSWFKNNN